MSFPSLKRRSFVVLAARVLIPNPKAHCPTLILRLSFSFFRLRLSNLNISASPKLTASLPHRSQPLCLAAQTSPSPPHSLRLTASPVAARPLRLTASVPRPLRLTLCLAFSASPSPPHTLPHLLRLALSASLSLPRLLCRSHSLPFDSPTPPHSSSHSLVSSSLPRPLRLKHFSSSPPHSSSRV